MQSHFVCRLLPLWVVDSMQLIGSNVKHNQLDLRSFCNGGAMIGQMAGWVSSLHLLRMIADWEHMAVVCSQVCIIFKHLDESLKRSIRGYEGGGVDSSSAASCKDKEWLNQPTSGGDGGSEWGVLVNFLLHGCFLEIAMSINEFNGMEFDVCSGLCGK